MAQAARSTGAGAARAVHQQAPVVAGAAAPARAAAVEVDSPPVRTHSTAFLSSHEPQQNVALVFLNSPGVHAHCGAGQASLFERVWRASGARLCADGAANRLYDGLAQETRRQRHLPDLIRGDLDSLRPDVRAYYEAKGVRVERDPDQSTHDLDKCLQALHTHHANQALRMRADGDDSAEVGEDDLTVVVLGAFGGRLDQMMSNLNMLYRWQSFGQMIMMSEDCLALLLPPGEHRIVPNPEFESSTCGLIPIGAPSAEVHTSGLKWNLDGTELAFGGVVSSSNEVVADEVSVRTSGPLVWTTVLHDTPYSAGQGGADEDTGFAI